MRAALPALLAVVLVVLAAFHPVWLRGDSLMAAQAGPGVTMLGPAGAGELTHAQVADNVAACIDEPQAVLARRQLDAGHWPWWNPHNALGVPLFGNWQSSLLSPLRLLVLTRPQSTWSFDLTYILRLLVAGVGACLLARRLGLRDAGAAAAGIAFALTGYFLRYLPMHHLNAEVWLPWLWLTADGLAQRRRLRDLFGFTFVVFAIVAGGNPQPALVAALATAAFAGWRWRAWGVRGFATVALAAVPPVLLASSYWLAGLEYVRESVHHHDASFGADGFTAAGALGFVLATPYGAPGPISLVAPHFGMVVCVLAALGLGIGLGRSVFLWALLVLTAGKLANLPGTGWLGHLPGLEVMKIFKYGYPVPALLLALLAGNGVVAAARAWSWRALALRATPVLALVGCLLWAGARAADRSEWLTLHAWGGLAWRLTLVAVLFVALRTLSPSRRALAAVAVLTLELVGAYPTRWSPRLEPFAKPEYLRAITDRPGTFRTFGAGGMLIPNQNAALGVDDVRLHDGVFPRRYGKFVRALLNPNVRHWPVFTGEDLGEMDPRVFAQGEELQRLLLPQRVTQELAPSVRVDITAPTPARFFDLLNVEYLVLPPIVGPWVTTWPKADYEVVHEGPQAIVVKRKTALPRAFFPAGVEAIADEDQALLRMAAPEFAPRELALLEGDLAGVAAGPVRGAGIARLRERTAPTELVFDVQVASPAWLVISVSPYPGVRALIDGKPADLLPANAALSAVLVPAGRREVRVVYEPQTKAMASWLTAVGALGLLALAFATARVAQKSEAWD